ncbi:hypothetical protein BDD12DRAFT_903410 [Trichophaea hybrida]|nr:hypothetical protein BDD12DRAFT_903410 [Trichophaea hybrida]
MPPERTARRKERRLRHPPPPPPYLERKQKPRQSPRTRIQHRPSFLQPPPGSLKPATVIERPTQGQRRLAFGERKYVTDCGSELSEPAQPESDNDYDYEEDKEDDGLKALATDPFTQIQMLREEFECSLFTVQTELLAKIAIVPSKIKEAAQTVDAKDLRRRVDDLEGKNRKLETTVETLLVEAKKAKEEKKLATLRRLSHRPPCWHRILPERPTSF